ncbi:MAG: NAD(P)H-hydrate epimerase [Caldilineaceae bacterium]|nr:NAD(P)H-hydrate epimerase [Caldilineaceae bacterium]HRJ41786.1 NAD(P)H-hydrate epimerase [Caldilineaceae bacterium]
MLTLPSLSTAQMVEVDRLMIVEYHIELLQMMENAGRNLALLAKRLLDGDVADRPVVVLAGRGNNGGGGLVAARHLLNWGAWVQLLLTHRPEEYRGVPAHQLSILTAMDAPLAWAEDGWELPPADLIIDALIGYGLQGNPTGNAATLISLANSNIAPILSLDAPSGLDSNSGQLYNPHINATATMTLALPKAGLLTAPARPAVGQLYLADISVPPALYQRLGLDVPPLFAADPILPVEIRDGIGLIPDV